MSQTSAGKKSANSSQEKEPDSNSPTRKASEAQLRYLRQGLEQPGGKLPLFDPDGKQIPAQTIRSCIGNGWAEPWFDNPLNPGWLVCKLTDEGRKEAARKT